MSSRPAYISDFQDNQDYITRPVFKKQNKKYNKKISVLANLAVFSDRAPVWDLRGFGSLQAVDSKQVFQQEN